MKTEGKQKETTIISERHIQALGKRNGNFLCIEKMLIINSYRGEGFSRKFGPNMRCGWGVLFVCVCVEKSRKAPRYTIPR